MTEEEIDSTEKVEGEEVEVKAKPEEVKTIDPVIQVLSGFSANQSYCAMTGILGWASYEVGLTSEDDYTEFAREVISHYSQLIDARDFSNLTGLLYDSKKRTDLILGFLFALKKEYRNAWMQIMLQSIGCFEIAGKSLKIQEELHKADPNVIAGLKNAFLESVKPELRDEALAVVESIAGIIAESQKYQ